MKKTVVLISALCALACQKQNVEPQSVTSTNESAAVAVSDSVKFDTIEPGQVEDEHNGRTVCMLEGFTITPIAETSYVRKFSFTIFKSPGATLTSAKLFIDGEKPHILPITSNKLTFIYKSHPLTDAAFGPKGWHTIAMRIVGNGAAGQWYQVRLDSANFLKFDPKRNMVVTHLPQTSYKMIY